jgi:hypothetical protein
MSVDNTVTSVSAAFPQLACSAAVRGSTRATAVAPEQTLADLLGNSAALRVDADGRVFAQFGIVRSGLPDFLASAANDAASLKSLTGALVRERIVAGDGGLLAQLAVSLADVDCAKVAELIAGRARTRHQQLVATGQAAEQHAVAQRVEDAEVAQRRADLLAELAQLDGPPATGQTGPEVPKRRFWR